MLEIEDLSLLKITKVKPWTISFDYDNKHYFLHGRNEEYEEFQELYEKYLDKDGNYTLKFIKGRFGKEYVKSVYIKNAYGKAMVYSQIDKEFFVKQLMKYGFVKPINIG